MIKHPDQAALFQILKNSTKLHLGIFDCINEFMNVEPNFPCAIPSKRVPHRGRRFGLLISSPSFPLVNVTALVKWKMRHESNNSKHAKVFASIQVVQTNKYSLSCA